MADFRFHEWNGGRNFRFAGPALPHDQSNDMLMAEICRKIKIMRGVDVSQGDVDFVLWSWIIKLIMNLTEWHRPKFDQNRVNTKKKRWSIDSLHLHEVYCGSNW